MNADSDAVSIEYLSVLSIRRIPLAFWKGYFAEFLAAKKRPNTFRPFLIWGVERQSVYALRIFPENSLIFLSFV
jgi:hypothetical protein